jgi:hypothetical protein
LCAATLGVSPPIDYIATATRSIGGVTNKRQSSISVVKIQLLEPNNVNGLHQTNMILEINKSGIQHLTLTATISSIGETRQSLLQKNYYPAVPDLLMTIFSIKM